MVKANQILENAYEHGTTYIRAIFNKENQFKTEEEAQYYIDEWTKVEQYKAQVKQLREAINLYFEGGFDDALEQALKDTE